MPVVGDFRNYAFDRTRVDASGKDVGRKVYWKMYAIENLIRVLVHSVLTVQAGTNWWADAVDPGIQKQVSNRMAEYAKHPWHSNPGKHHIYYTFLPDLNKIIVAHSHLFKPVIHDIDQWVAKIEQIRLPRNVVGHMNWPSATDRQRIDVFYADIQQLMNQLAGSGLNLTIP